MPISGKIALVADDNSVVRHFVWALIAHEGYQTLIARDGQEALKIANAWDGAIHLVISDLRMPGLDGLELATAVRTARPETSILIVSGEPGAERLIVHRGFAFLAKPFTPAALLTKLRDVMESSLLSVSIPSPAAPALLNR